MLVNDANGKHLVAPGVLYVIQKYVYKKIKKISTGVWLAVVIKILSFYRLSMPVH